MATARSLELQALARRVADGLPPEIDEVLLTGSASRGVADEDSDFEMLLVGETLPPPEEIAAGLDVFDVGEMPDRRGWWIGGTAEGEPFELIAWTRARTEERVAGILAAEIVDHIRIRTAEAIVHGLPLRTSGRLARVAGAPPHAIPTRWRRRSCWTRSATGPSRRRAASARCFGRRPARADEAPRRRSRERAAHRLRTQPRLGAGLEAAARDRRAAGRQAGAAGGADRGGAAAGRHRRARASSSATRWRSRPTSRASCRRAS